MLAIALTLSVVGLALGPVLLALGRGRESLTAALEGFTLGIVPSLIFLRIVPHLYHSIAASSLVLLAAGYLTIVLADRWTHHAGTRIGAALVVPALALHAMTDGAGLALATASMGGDARAGSLLGAALLLHRLPEGLFIASALVPELGWRRAIQRLALIALATIVGGVAGNGLLRHIPDALLDGAIAFGLGAILRLIAHTHTERPATVRARALSGLGFLAGVAVAVGAPGSSELLLYAQPSELSFIRAIVPLFVITSPAIVCALAIKALFAIRTDAVLILGWPQNLANGLLDGVRRPPARELGNEFFVGRPTSVQGAVGFISSAASQWIESTGLVIVLLGPLFAAWRIGTTLVVLVVASVAASWGTKAGSFARIAEREKPADLGARLRASLERTVDSIGAPYLLGLLIAAAIEATVGNLARSDLFLLESVIAIAIAFVFSGGAVAVVPIAAILVHKGFPVGVALAVILIASCANFSVLTLVARAVGRRSAAIYAVAMTIGAIAIMLTFAMRKSNLPSLHHAFDASGRGLDRAWAIVLAIILFVRLLRLGVRDWAAFLSHQHEHGEEAPTADVVHVDAG